MEYYFSRKWFAVSTIMVYLHGKSKMLCYEKKKTSSRINGRESITNVDDQVIY